MASLVEELVSVLAQEEKIYEVFYELGQKKTQVLIDADVPTLEQITATEQQQSDKLLALSNKQLTILKDISTVLGAEEKEMTVTKLIGLMDSQPKVKQQLIAARDSLLESANRVQTLNQQNEVLIRQAIDMAEFDITLFKSLRQAPETANYDRSAYNTGSILGGSGFDAKQ